MAYRLSDDMSDNQINNLPEDEKIAEMLSQFAPQPTSRFNNKMSVAPWQRHTSHEARMLPINIKSNHKLIWVLLVLGLVCAVILVMIIPSARVAATQLIHLFLPAPSNQLNVQVTLISPGDFVDFSNPSNFPLSISEVQQLAGFGVKQISLFPDGLTFSGARYDRSFNTVIFLYEANDYILFLTQRPIQNGGDVFSIGESANVKKVTVGNIEGEFVTGGWKAVSTQPAPDDQTSAGTMNIYAVWDNGLSQSTLRWQVSDIVYELRSNGEGSPSQSELINLANGLK
jgi:hypothetical protein